MQLRNFAVLIFSLWIVGFSIYLVLEPQWHIGSETRKSTNNAYHEIHNMVPSRIQVGLFINISSLAKEDKSPNPLYGRDNKIIKAIAYFKIPYDKYLIGFSTISNHFKNDGYEYFISNEYDGMIDIALVSKEHSNQLCSEETCHWKKPD